MMTRLLEGMLPLLLAQVSATGLHEKRSFAVYVRLLAESFEKDDRQEFGRLLEKSAIPEMYRDRVTKALWNNANKG